MVEYCVPDSDPETWFPLKSVPDADMEWLNTLVSRCASDFYHKRDGYESRWPLDFLIRADGYPTVRFCVDVERVAEFYSFQIDL